MDVVFGGRKIIFVLDKFKVSPSVLVPGAEPLCKNTISFFPSRSIFDINK